MKPLLITIDGPAGAGKTSVSRRLADRLGYTYVDTGALYRGVAYAAMAKCIESDDDKRLQSLMEDIDLRFKHLESGIRLFLDGDDITDEIRTPAITMMASAVSARPVVRNALLDLQRRLGDKKAVVFEGRDMGTVVFPSADVKFFLTADIRTRAARRYAEMKGGNSHTLEQVEADMRTRDQNDSTRAAAPLVPAKDSVRVDSSGLTIDAVIDKMLAHVRSALKRL